MPTGTDRSGWRMNATVLFILVIAGALIVMLGTAYALDQRRMIVKAKSKASPGPVSRVLPWISYGILLMTVLFIIAAFALNEMIFANLAWSLIMLYIIVGVIYRIAKSRGI
jgi:hypothetical protein